MEMQNLDIEIRETKTICKHASIQVPRGGVASCARCSGRASDHRERQRLRWRKNGQRKKEIRLQLCDDAVPKAVKCGHSRKSIGSIYIYI